MFCICDWEQIACLWLLHYSFILLTKVSDASAVGGHCYRQWFETITMSHFCVCIESTHYVKNTRTLIFILICFHSLHYWDMFWPHLHSSVLQKKKKSPQMSCKHIFQIFPWNYNPNYNSCQNCLASFFQGL